MSRRGIRRVGWYVATRFVWFALGWLANLGMAVAASKNLGSARKRSVPAAGRDPYAYGGSE